MARVHKSKKRRPAKKATARSKRFADAASSPSFETISKLMTAGIPLDGCFERERQQRLEKMKAQLNALISMGRGAEAVDQMLLAVIELERANERLTWRIMRANRYRFGRSSEKLTPEELQQMVLAFGGDEASAAEASPSVPVPAEPEQQADEEGLSDDSATGDKSDESLKRTSPKRKRRKSVARMWFGENVEQNITISKVPDEERYCSGCEAEMDPISEVRHENIRYEPAKIVVDVVIREKVACKRCRSDIDVAPRVNAPAVVRKVDASLLAKLVAEKCALALPVDRQRRELENLGLHVPYNTLQSYWAYSIDLLEPIAVACLSEAFGCPIVGVDDTHLKTLKPKGGTFRGHLWCFVGGDGALNGQESVAYGYTPTWDATEIVDWFSAIDGFIQCDGYAGYASEVEVESEATDADGQPTKTVVAVPNERRLGCGMHIRAKFYDALKANDKRANVPLKHFLELYAIERECKNQQLDVEARHRQRLERSLPIVKEFYDWIHDIHPKLLPKSPLRRATTYAINQQEFFERCFSDGRFEIDNGRVERRIRLFTVARRNFLFTGSPRGGERLAAAFTLVDNALLLGINPEHYLVDVIRKLERGWPMSRLSELTPRCWAAQQALEQRAQ